MGKPSQIGLYVHCSGVGTARSTCLATSAFLGRVLNPSRNRRIVRNVGRLVRHADHGTRYPRTRERPRRRATPPARRRGQSRRSSDEGSATADLSADGGQAQPQRTFERALRRLEGNRRGWRCRSRSGLQRARVGAVRLAGAAPSQLREVCLSTRRKPLPSDIPASRAARGDAPPGSRLRLARRRAGGSPETPGLMAYQPLSGWIETTDEPED